MLLIRYVRVDRPSLAAVLLLNVLLRKSWIIASLPK